MDAAIRDAIVRAATESGIDPNVALAIAERESGFNPQARSSKTIRGLFQMQGGHRREYGVGDSDDPYAQANGWGAFFADNKGEMARVLGRAPTDAEGYLGHHFGGVRAARMMKMDPETPVDQVFTRQERRLNPHFDKAGTVGELNSSVLADLDKRQARLSGAVPDFSGEGTVLEAGPAMYNDVPKGTLASAADFSSLGTPAGQPQPSATQLPSAPDLSEFGTPA